MERAALSRKYKYWLLLLLYKKETIPKVNVLWVAPIIREYQIYSSGHALEICDPLENSNKYT